MDEGLTLIELMVMIAVITIALASLMHVIVSSDIARQVSEETAQAQNEALRRLEEIIARGQQDFDGLPNYINTNPTFVVNELRNATGTLTIDITNPNLYNVTATITYTGTGEVQKTYSTKAMITR